MNQELKAGQVMVSYGQLHKGFMYTQQKFVIVTERRYIWHQKEDTQET